jgi:hypothetical protein
MCRRWFCRKRKAGAPIRLVMMKKLLTILLVSFWVAVVSQGHTREGRGDNQGLAVLLPSASETGGWEREGEPQTHRGDALFLLVNGGAELYFEYGFERAVAATYHDTAQKWISLEIYEMKDAGGAYGIYTSKRGASGELLSMGNKALMAGYYLNFWKGNFLVTLTGGDGSPETVETLKRIARAVDRKIQGRGTTPAIVHLLPEAGMDPLSQTYIRGNLGFSKHGGFRTPCRFAVKEGVVAEYGKLVAHVLKYEDPLASNQAFSDLSRCLKSIEEFRVIREGSTRVTVEDDQGLFIGAEQEGRHVIILSGEESPRVDSIGVEIKKRIRRGSS